MTLSPSRLALRYADWVIRLRYPLLGLVLVSSLLAALAIPSINLRNDPDSLLPAHNRHVLTNAFVEQTFGMSNFIVVALEVDEGDIYQAWFVNKLRTLHQRLETLPYARPSNFMSLAAKKARAIQGGPDGLDIHRLIPRTGIDARNPARAERQLQALRDGLRGNVAIRDMLVSADAKAAFIIADFGDQVKDDYLHWVEQLETILDDAKDPRVTLRVAGEPYFFARMLVELRSHAYLFTVAAALVGLLLFLESRLLRAALLPLVGVSVSVLWTLGLMGIAGHELTTMVTLTPVLIFAIGIGHSIQAVRRYLERLSRCGCHQQAAREAIARTIIPASVAIVTDASGFLVLSLVDISFYRAYAFFGQFGMFSLLLSCTTLVPLLLYLLPPPKPRDRPNPVQDWEVRMGSALTGFITGPKKWLPLGITALLWLVSAGLLTKTEQGINFAEAAFKPDSQTVADLRRLNAVTPGVISFNIPFIGERPGALRQPALLQAIAAMEETLRTDPDIGFTLSLPQYLRLLNRHLNGDDPDHWTVPDDAATVEQLLLVYELGADPEDFKSVVDYDYRNGQLIGYINTMDPARVHRVTQEILDYIRIHRDDPAFAGVQIGIPEVAGGPPGLGGFAGTTEAAREVSHGQWLLNPLLAALLVALVTFALFRSAAMVALILLMVITTLVAQYGLAGYFSAAGVWGGNLHFGNLVTLSIAMGLGVDYSIYLAWRFRNEYARECDLDSAMRNTLSTTGSAVVLSVLVLLICLLPLLLTPLANIWGLAIYIGSAVLVSVFTAMTVLPILIRAAVHLPQRLYRNSNLLNLQVSERTVQLRREKRQLRDALDLLRQAQHQLVESEKMASLGGLVAGVAHEVNTPVGNALTLASHLRSQTDALARSYQQQSMTRSALETYLHDADQACRIIGDNLERAAALVRSFKKVAVDQTSEERRCIPVRAYLEEVLLSLRPKLTEAAVTINLACDPELEIETFPGALSQVISHLVLNALLHAFEPGGGTITIRVSRRSAPPRRQYPFPTGASATPSSGCPPTDSVLLRFHDDGRGIPSEHLSKLFEPFFTTRRSNGSSGLGLNIVYNIVTQTFGGEIHCVSEPHQGTEFILCFPECAPPKKNPVERETGHPIDS